MTTYLHFINHAVVRMFLLIEKYFKIIVSIKYMEHYIPSWPRSNSILFHE